MSQPPTEAEHTTELQRAAADYGTPAQRTQRTTDAKTQEALAKTHAQDAANAPRGRR